MSIIREDTQNKPVWAPWVTLHVDIASPFATTQPAGVWDLHRWDQPTAIWGGNDPNWAEITCEVSDLKIARGRRGVLERVPTSTCALDIVNDTGWAAWSDDPDPEVSLGLRPGRSLRVVASSGSTSGTLWSGWLQSSQEHYPAYGGGPPTSSLAGVDSLSRLALVDPLPLTVEVGAGEAVHERLARLAAEAAWPVSRTAFEPSPVLMQGTKLEKNLLDEAYLTIDSEGGVLYADRDGLIRSRSRDWLRSDPKATTVQATFSNTDAPGDHCYATMTTAGPDVDTVQNRVIVGKAGGTPVQYDDLDSQSLYAVRTFKRTDYMTSQDEQVQLLGQRRLLLTAEPQRRITGLVIEPLADPEVLFPFVLSVDYGWRLHVEYQHPSGEWGWEGDVHVHGIEHTVAHDGWRTTLKVEDASFWKAGSGWNRDLWDQARWVAAPTRNRNGGFSAWL